MEKILKKVDIIPYILIIFLILIELIIFEYYLKIRADFFLLNLTAHYRIKNENNKKDCSY